MTEQKAQIVVIETTGTKAANELGKSVKSLLIDVNNALEDGKISGDEIATMALKNFQGIMSVAKEVKNIPIEAKQEPLALARGIINPITEGIEVFL